MSASDLDGRVAVVSGAGGGIGLGTVQSLAERGANCVLLVRRAESGAAARAAIEARGRRAVVVCGDVACAETSAAAVDAARQHFGRLDIVVHNAVDRSAAEPLQFTDADDGHWARQMGVALDGGLHLARSALPLLRRSPGARFVVLVAAAAMHGSVRNVVYTSVKGAQRGFVKALAREWAPLGITVNAIAPVAVSDGSQRHFESNPQLLAPLLAGIPMGRIGDPKADVGAAIAALCTDAFAYLTGQTLCLDGGVYTAL